MAIFPSGVADDGLAWSTITRAEAGNNNLTGNQNLRLTCFTARANGTSTGVRTLTTSTAAGATPTLVRLGLYSIALNGDGTLIASSPNDTTLYAVADAQYSRTWSAPVDIVTGERYAVGILVVTGAVAPELCGAYQRSGATDALGPANLVLPWFAGLITGQADLPASFLYSSLLSNLNPHYAQLY
jgi:hypothetical protein